VIRSQTDRGHPAERHADDCLGGRRQTLDRDGEVGRHRGRCVVVGWSVVTVAVSGEVDRHERTSERHGHRVPGMGVLGATMNQHQFGVTLAPHQRRDAEAGWQLDAFPSHGRWRSERQVVFGGVLVEQPELVVVVHVGTLEQSLPHAHVGG